MEQLEPVHRERDLSVYNEMGMFSIYNRKKTYYRKGKKYYSFVETFNTLPEAIQAIEEHYPEYVQKEVIYDQSA